MLIPAEICKWSLFNIRDVGELDGIFKSGNSHLLSRSEHKPIPDAINKNKDVPNDLDFLGIGNYLRR